MDDQQWQFQILREEIRYEHGLICQRFNWFVASQAFLVSPYVVARANAPAKLDWFWGTLLPFIGLTLAMLIFLAIRAAVLRVRDHRVKQLSFVAVDPMSPGDEVWRCVATWVPQATPLIFMLMWLVLSDGYVHVAILATMGIAVVTEFTYCEFFRTPMLKQALIAKVWRKSPAETVCETSNEP